MEVFNLENKAVFPQCIDLMDSGLVIGLFLYRGLCDILFLLRLFKKKDDYLLP